MTAHSPRAAAKKFPRTRTSEPAGRLYGSTALKNVVRGRGIYSKKGIISRALDYRLDICAREIMRAGMDDCSLHSL